MVSMDSGMVSTISGHGEHGSGEGPGCSGSSAEEDSLAAKRLTMRQLREILRLRHECGLPQREVAKAVKAGKGTISEYLGKAEAAGVGWPIPEELATDEALEARVFGVKPEAQSDRAAVDTAWVHAELRRPGVTLSLLWQEYLEANPGGYKYSQFCEHYHRYRKRLSPVMRQVYVAGEKAFVDFAGKKPSVVDPRTGEVRSVELFVGALGASSYVYAEAAERQDLGNWIRLNVHMVEFFGGAPAIFVPDNLKAGVTGPCRYEAIVNRTYEEMASHYGAAVIPARVYKPRDKAKAEVSVLLAERWILASLRNRTFFSLGELNEAIRGKVRELNERVMKRMGTSRRELFEKYDLPALKPLPAVPYEMGVWKGCGVNIDYHVEYEHNLYSVPHALVGQRVEVRATAGCVEVYLRSTRVASHPRLSGRGRPSTLAEHMPAAHRAHAEWSPSRLVLWAGKTGEATKHVVEAIFKSRPHPEQGYRACLGLMRLGRNHGPERLEAACLRARLLGAESYKTVKNILSNGMDRHTLPAAGPESTLPLHENIRGAACYAEGEVLPC
jgi:transposase